MRNFTIYSSTWQAISKNVFKNLFNYEPNFSEIFEMIFKSKFDAEVKNSNNSNEKKFFFDKFQTNIE